MKNTTRRDFVKKTTLALGTIPFLTNPFSLWSANEMNDKLTVHIFSKHLQFLDYMAVGEKAAEIGFSGVDLTVRSGGHVLPEKVKNDLPKAVEEIKKGGSRCDMITTKVENINNDLDIDLLQTASRLGIKYYRSNWLKFQEDNTMENTLKIYQHQIKELSQVNKKLGLVGCYQNHAGTNVGAAIWEVKKLLELSDQNFFGAQYEIRHAVVEGGLSWENGLRLIHPYIKTIVLKDFKWGKLNGKWKAINTPIGEGMVDFKKYFRLLKKYQINVPISLHLEYPLGGAEKGANTLSVDKKIVFQAMKNDLYAIQELWAAS